MPSFTDVLSGASALASDVQQLIDALKGTAGKGVPISLTAVNDGVSFALAVRNNDAGASKTAIFYKADGSVLLQVDKNGVVASPDGTAGAAPLLTTTGTQTLTNKTLTSPVLNGAVTGTAGFNAFTTWSPTLTQNSGIALTTNYATYTQIGKLGIVTCNLTATAAGTTANGIIVGNLPLSFKYSTGGLQAVGSFLYNQSGTAVWTGTVVPNSATSVVFYTTNQTQPLGAAPSFAVANGHTVTFTLIFEVA